MIKEGHFGYYEGYSLITIALITKIFYTSPMMIIKPLGTAAWYGTIISCIVSLFFFLLLYILLKRFPEMDLYQIFEAVAGKPAGKLFEFVFAVYLIYYTGINLREFTTVLKIYSMPNTPLDFLLIAFLLVVFAMAYVGLEGIARVAYVFFYPIMGTLILLLLLAIPSYDFDFLKPFFGHGLMKTIQVGIIRSSAYDEIIFLAIIVRSVFGLQNFKKIGVASLLTTGIVFSSCLACVLASFQYTVGSEQVSGMYQISRIIYYSRFIQRLESIFLFIWIFTSVITVALGFYLAVSSYCRVFNIDNYRPLLLQFVTLAFLAAFMVGNVTEGIEIHLKIIREYSSAILVGIPVLVLAIALIRGKKGGMVNGKKT